MSGRMSEDEKKENLARLDRLVASMGKIQLEIQRKTLEYEEFTKPHKQAFEDSVDALTARREELMSQVIAVMGVLKASEALSGNSVKLRSGDVSIREASSLVITDELAFMRQARRLRIVRLVSKEPAKRRPDKTLLKRLLSQRPELMGRLADVLRRDVTRRLTVQPTVVQAEVARDLSPLQAEVFRS